MNVTAAFAHAALPECYVVCGIRLRPFSIGHWILFQRFNVSFLTGQDHTLGDLLLATIVCSSSYEDALASLQDSGLAGSIARWRYKLAGGAMGSLKRILARWRGGSVRPDDLLGLDFAAECKAMQEYVDQHGAGFEPVNEWSHPTASPTRAGESMGSAVPGILMLLDGLQSEIGFTTHEAVNMPLPLARWRWAIHSERKGWAKIIDVDESKKIQDEADAIARKVFNGNNS